jgi:hypothetical protein
MLRISRAGWIAGSSPAMTLWVRAGQGTNAAGIDSAPSIAYVVNYEPVAFHRAAHDDDDPHRRAAGGSRALIR